MDLPVTVVLGDVAANIAGLINEFEPSIIVIDSINPLMEFIRTNEQRAWLQNFSYNLTTLVGAAVVLTAELPLRRGEGLVGGDVQLVAGSLIVLKLRIDVGKLFMVMEIKGGGPALGRRGVLPPR